ncbi:hypothetical protein GGQ85_003598 [Nitrobacter vulgaris]|jgi:hypothetical protein|uniref:hypothetical protein n=1 Tax=Nitrobacter vulgaris TaxID=29421 RepID=UPI00285B8686|nr:hypothetical protein [Nitrobacter vulgaris]MDR6305867.1 hypothetical protein [Nitrobacter vulgaris]MDR6305872.1 hypothetical protein [Nitrobacter vulgaris]
MNDIVAFTRERFRHVKRGSGPEPHLASIADRGECDPPPCMVIESLVVTHLFTYQQAQQRGLQKATKEQVSEVRTLMSRLQLAI